MGSEGGDVVECVVQLLADGLVLHLLCIDFIWGGRGKCGEREWREGKRQGRREGNGKREKESEKWTEKQARGQAGQLSGSFLPALSSLHCTPR